MSIAPPSTRISLMNTCAASISAPSFLTFQFSIAESNSLCKEVAASFWLNFRIANAFSTEIPRTKSATKRILRGDVGQLFNLAKATLRFASLISIAFSLLRTPIAFIFYLYSLHLRVL